MQNWHKRLELYCLILTGVMALFFIAYFNLGNPNFWFDESGQVWTAYGLHQNAEAFSPKGELAAVWNANIEGNLDPALFTFLLRAWMEFSTHPVFLRALPFLFFIVGLCVLWSLGRTLNLSRGQALLLSLLPLTVVRLLDWSVVVRAYSLWTLGFLFIVYYGLAIAQGRNPRAMGVILGLALLTRYPIIIAMMSFLLALRFSHIELSWKRHRAAILAFLFFLGVYFFNLFSHYMAKTSELTPQYTFALHLSRMGMHKMLLRVLESFSDVWILVPLAFLLLFFSVKEKIVEEKAKKGLSFLAYFSLVHHGLLIFFSFLRLHPWGIYERFNLDLVYLGIVNLAGIWSILSYFFPSIVERAFKVLVPIGLLFVLLKTSSYRFLPYSQSYELVAEHFRNFPREKLYVDEALSSEVRFLFEFGAYKDSNISHHYPRSLVFLHHREKKLELLSDTNFLISQYNWDKIQHKWPAKSGHKLLSPRRNSFLVRVKGLDTPVSAAFR